MPRWTQPSKRKKRISGTAPNVTHALIDPRLLAFPPLLASVRFRNGAKVVGQHYESSLHKVKIVLETWEVNKKLMKNFSLQSSLTEAWDKLVKKASVYMEVQVTRGIFHGIPLETIE